MQIKSDVPQPYDGSIRPRGDEILKSAVEFLKGHQIPYHVLPCGFASPHKSCLARRHPISVEIDINTIIVSTNKFPRKYAAFVLPADRKIVGSIARRVFASGKFSFTGPEELGRVTGMTPGAVTPFALPEEVRIFVDENLVELDWGMFGSGSLGWKIVTSPRALFNISRVTKVNGLAHKVV